jgi:hypothetical protein
MWKMPRVGVVVPVIGVLLTLTISAAMAGSKAPLLNNFEAEGIVNYIAPVSGWITIDRKRYRLAKGVKVFGLGKTRQDVRSALKSIRGQNVGYILDPTPQSNVVTAILVFP